MRIKYNPNHRRLEIKDWLNVQYFVVGVLIVFNLINTALNLRDFQETGLDFFKIAWLIIGIISVLVAIYFIIRKSSMEKIPIDMIDGLIQRSIFGKRRFSLKLKNGKTRDLTDVKTQSDFNELQHLFSEIGIKTLKNES